MKIVHISDGYPPRLGGIERQVHDLAARQHADGHAVGVVTTVPGRHYPPLPGPTVLRPRLRRRRSATALRSVWAIRGSRTELISRADLVHVHMSSVSPLAFFAAARAARQRVPTVITVHSLLDWADPLFAALNTVLGWRRGNLVWSAVSAAAAEPLRRVLGPGCQVAVLPNAVDTESWFTGDQLRPSDPTRLVIVTVGRLAARKRPAQLLALLRSARERLDRNVRLDVVVIGEGPLHKSLARYLRRHDMQAWVRLTGAYSPAQIRDAYRDADVYIAPAILESFGIAALEARCAGLPVLARAGSGVAEFITDGLDGLLAADDEQMARHVVELATDPQRRDRMRRHIRATRPPFDWSDVLPQTYALYLDAMARADTGAAERLPTS